MTLRAPTISISAALIAVLAVAAALVFQDNLARFFLGPKTPFQVAAPPPPPDYAEHTAWAIWPQDHEREGAADVFYVHSTTFYSSKGWNASIADDDANQVLEMTAAPNEAGPCLPLGPVFAPKYRQATLFAFFTHKFDGIAARQLAYQDVRRAFRKFLAESDGERPIVLVGYGQGGLHVQRLLEEFFQSDKKRRARLAAAYVIGQATPLRLFRNQLSETPPCAAPDAVRCVIAYSAFEPRFDEEMQRAKRRSMVWTTEGDLVAARDMPLLCVNPLSWEITEDYVSADAHLGAASATGLKFGAVPPSVTHALGARCSGGVLVVDRPVQDYLRRRAWFGAKWRAQNFNLFYFDLTADARRRVDIVAARLEEEAKYLDPIEETIDLRESPINKVPKL